MRNNSKSATLRMPSLLKSRNSLLHLCGHLLKESKSSHIFHSGDWMLSHSRTTSSKRSDFVVLGTAKLRQRKNISWPTTRGGDVSKRNLMEFTIASNEIQYILIRNSKIGWTEEKCIAMDTLTQEDHSYCPSSEEHERCKKNWFVSLNKSGRHASMKLRSDFREAVTIMNRLHRESGEERPEPIPFYQHQRWHSSSSSSSTSWWQWNEIWWSFFSRKFVVSRSFTADGNLLQPTRGVNRTPSHVTFSRICTHV